LEKYVTKKEVQVIAREKYEIMMFEFESSEEFEKLGVLRLKV
jgi:hypothetical protein